MQGRTRFQKRWTVCRRNLVHGNLAVEAHYTPKGNLKYISYIECNSQGLVIRQSDYGPNNEQMGYCTYEYDSQGRIICNSYFGPDGGLIDYVTYEYDQAGNQSGRAKYDKNGQLSWRAGLQHYNEHGNYREVAITTEKEP